MAKILQSSLAAVLVIAVPVVASSSGLSSSPGTDKVGTKLAESPALRMLDNILIKHAVLTVFAWTFFVPLGAIVLRPNIQSPLLFKIYAYFQMCWYLIYIVAVGFGIWFSRESAKYMPTWSDLYVIIGLVVLVAALF
jgi:hypothetical protein